MVEHRKVLDAFDDVAVVEQQMQRRSKALGS